MTQTKLPLTELAQATPDWLTDTLTANGHLKQGRAIHVQYNTIKQAQHLEVTRLQVGYSTDAAYSGHDSAPPPTMIFKFSKAGNAVIRAPRKARREFEFYTKIASAMSNAPVAQCYDAALEAQSGRFHLLLENLSTTHSHTSHPLPPPISECRQILATLARFHATWWNDPRVGTAIGGPFLKESRSKRTPILQRRTEEFLDFLGDRISDSHRNVLREACASYPNLLKRQNSGCLTIVHGDAHYENFLIASGDMDCRIIDWESWQIAPATDDLAYMMAVLWFAERRQRMEQDLLRHYHLTLTASGVHDYSWDTLWNDYRLSVIKHLCTPVIQWSEGLKRVSWWNNLERRLAAYEDLDCAEIMAQLKRLSVA